MIHTFSHDRSSQTSSCSSEGIVQANQKSLDFEAPKESKLWCQIYSATIAITRFVLTWLNEITILDRTGFYDQVGAVEDRQDFA